MAFLGVLQCITWRLTLSVLICVPPRLGALSDDTRWHTQNGKLHDRRLYPDAEEIPGS